MDPESGSLVLPGAGAPLHDVNQQSIVQKLIQVLRDRIESLVNAIRPKQQGVGVENRFYYDEVEKVWKLQGGETEQERAESQAISFHTSRGMSSGIAPPTTACDASRGAFSGDVSCAPPLPPPPTAGPVTGARQFGSGLPSSRYAPTLPSHPVYAPSSGLSGAASVPPPAAGPPPVVPAATSEPAPGPLTSPFGAVSAAPPPSQAPLTSPFGVSQAQAAPLAPTPLASPFQQVGVAPTPLATPFQQSTAGIATTPLASPFQQNTSATAALA